MTSASLASPSVPLRQDASLIGLIGVAHMMSHFSQLTECMVICPWDA